MKFVQSLALDMRVGRSLAFAAIALAMLPLAACLGGGGGSGGGSVADAGTAQRLTGGEAPIETPSDQEARAPAILERMDSLIISTMHGTTTHPEVPNFSLRSNCAGTQCRFTEPRTGVSVVIGLDDLEFVSGDSRAVLTKNGVTLIDGTASIDNAAIKAYGAWMAHAAFAAQVESTRVEGFAVDGRYAVAGGDLTGTIPTVSGTWSGLMVGRPRSGDNVLQGDAALTFTVDGAGGMLDAAFTNIVDLDRGTPHSTPSTRFVDIPVSSNGAYGAGSTGNRIQGAFYGPDHAETAGVFEQADIVGAFGAKRQ